MPIEILMPALSPTMTDGKLAKWLVEEGDKVQAGDIIAEIETDKATMELETIDEGTVAKILVLEGAEGVPVNDTICILSLENDSSTDTQKSIKELNTKDLPRETKPIPEKTLTPPPTETKTPPDPNPTGSNTKDLAEKASEDRILASPLAKRIAEKAGLGLGGIIGSGPNGRILKLDVEGALKESLGNTQDNIAAKSTNVSVAEKPSPPNHANQSQTAVPHTKIRKVIAERVSQSKQEVPHFYLTVECQIDNLLLLRKELNSTAGSLYKLSVNDFIVKAAGLAMKQIPSVNAIWTEQEVRLFSSVDVAVAVAAKTGLITPIVTDVDNKRLSEISNEIKDLARRANENKLKPHEFQGGGFSISNLGMYGIKEFSAIINQPQAAILAIGAAEEIPIVKEGAVSIGTLMRCTLSCDHRVIDGVLGAEFLSEFKRLLSNPLQLLV